MPCPEIEKLELFLAAWLALRDGQWTTAAELISEAEPANDFSTARSDKRAALYETLLEVANDGRGLINRKALGWYLRHFEGRIASGLRLTKKPRLGNTKAAHEYRVERLVDSNPAATGTDDIQF